MAFIYLLVTSTSNLCLNSRTLRAGAIYVVISARGLQMFGGRYPREL